MALALKKPCCCGGSLRICSLILLFLFWIDAMLMLKSDFSALRDPLYENFISSNKFTFYGEMLILMIGIFICLLSIISISKEFQRTIFLLNAFVVLVILYDILLIIEIFLCNFNGTLDALINAKTANGNLHLQVPPDTTDEFRNATIQAAKKLALISWNFSRVANILFSFYAILVFYSYNVKLYNEAF